MLDFVPSDAYYSNNINCYQSRSPNKPTQASQKTRALSVRWSSVRDPAMCEGDRLSNLCS